jgi:hypothetical protein
VQRAGGVGQRNFRELARLVQRLSSENEYRVERMLRDLIATEAYGAP